MKQGSAKQSGIVNITHDTSFFIGSQTHSEECSQSTLIKGNQSARRSLCHHRPPITHTRRRHKYHGHKQVVTIGACNDFNHQDACQGDWPISTILPAAEEKGQRAEQLQRSLLCALQTSSVSRPPTPGRHKGPEAARLWALPAQRRLDVQSTPARPACAAAAPQPQPSPPVRLHHRRAQPRLKSALANGRDLCSCPRRWGRPAGSAGEAAPLGSALHQPAHRM